MQLPSIGTSNKNAWPFQIADPRHLELGLVSSNLVLDQRMVHSCFNRMCRRWTDTRGQPIEAHGAGMLHNRLDGLWYWYGESAKYNERGLWNWQRFNRSSEARQMREAILRQAAPGVNLYSAPSLGGPWRFEGEVLGQAHIEVSGLNGPWVIERPKVIFNERTGMFVMWFHLDNSEYTFRRAGVAVAARPIGPFGFLHALRPDGVGSLDLNLFRDPIDGQAYLLRSCDNEYAAISRLTPDYVSSDGMISKSEIFEGMALFRHQNGTYYMITSHLSGWLPNPLMLFRSEGKSLADPQWVNMGNPTRHTKSFNSQPTFVVDVTTAEGEPYFIYMGDNWIHAGPRHLQDASYVWLPFRFGKTSVTLYKRLAWDLNDPFGLKLKRSNRTA